MYLYKRGRIWWCDYMVASKRYRISCHTTNRKTAEMFTAAIKIARKMPSFEEAVDVLRKIYSADEPAAGIAIDAAWEIYERMARSLGRAKISASTAKKRRLTFNLLITWLKSTRGTVQTIEQVTPTIAAQYAAELDDGKRAAKTRRNHIMELSAVWSILEKASDRIRNPWKSLAPIGESQRGHAFTADEVDRILAAARTVGKGWPEVCELGLATGLRYGDIAMMRWDEIGADAIRLTPRKTARRRISVAIPIIEPIRAILERLPRRDDYLFPNHAEAYERDSGAARKQLNFAEVLKAANLYLPGYSFHSFRHTAASRLAAAGVGIETRKRILGHTEDATAARYDHDEHLREVAQALAAANKNPRKA